MNYHEQKVKTFGRRHRMYLLIVAAIFRNEINLNYMQLTTRPSLLISILLTNSLIVFAFVRRVLSTRGHTL